MDYIFFYDDTEETRAVVLKPENKKYEKVVLEVKKGQAPGCFARENAEVISLEENGVTFYSFFMPDGTTIISTDPDGHKYQLPKFSPPAAD